MIKPSTKEMLHMLPQIMANEVRNNSAIHDHLKKKQHLASDFPEEVQILPVAKQRCLESIPNIAGLR